MKNIFFTIAILVGSTSAIASELESWIQKNYRPRTACTFQTSVIVDSKATTSYTLRSRQVFTRSTSWFSASTDKNAEKSYVTLTYRALNPDNDINLKLIEEAPGIFVPGDMIPDFLEFQVKTVFNNRMNVYLKEVVTGQRDFSLHHRGAIAYEIREMKDATKIDVNNDPVIGKIELYQAFCN